VKLYQRATTAGTDARSLRTARVFVTAPAWVAIALTVIVAVLGDGLSPTIRYLPLIASAILLGLPHGAVDPFVLPRAFERPVDRRALVGVGLLYLLLGGAYAALWFLGPAVAAVVFIAITWFHWGQGDLHALVALLGADHLRTRAQRALTVVVRGGLPMLVPLLSFPGEYQRVLEAFVARFGVGFGITWPFTGRARLALAVGFLGLTGLSLLLGYFRADNRTPWLLDAGETALLWVFFILVPPVLAIGVYFTLWHALRHVCRTIVLDPAGETALAEGDLAGALGQFGREAAPLTALALVLIGAAVVVVPNPPTDVPSAIALYLVVIAVLTLPHVVVVSLLDYAEAIWRPA
jgi:Brp/Blh family beta-carotene 15,15'-monooxygenase